MLKRLITAVVLSLGLVGFSAPSGPFFDTGPRAGGGGGTGDVVGPALGTATDEAVCRFNTTSGKLIQNSTVLLDDLGNASGYVDVALQSISSDDLIDIQMTLGTDAGDDFRINNGADILVVEGDSGEVGIGTAAPVAPLHIHAGGTEVAGPTGTLLRLQNNATFAGNTAITMASGSGSTGAIHFGDEFNSSDARMEYDHSLGQFNFFLENTFKVTLNDAAADDFNVDDDFIYQSDINLLNLVSGNMVVGDNATAVGKLFVDDSSTGNIRNFTVQNVALASAVAPALINGRRGNTDGGAAAVNSGQPLFMIRADGTTTDGDASVYSDAGSNMLFRASQDWTPSANGTELLFQTTPNGTVTPKLAMVIANDGRVGITNDGTGTPTVRFEILETGTGPNRGGAVTQYTAGTTGAKLELRHSRNNATGTFGALQANDDLGLINYRGGDGAAFGVGAQTRAMAIENFGPGANGTNWIVSTTPAGSPTFSENLTVRNDGATIFTPDTDGNAQVAGINGDAVEVINTSTEGGRGLRVTQYLSAAGGSRLHLGKSRSNLPGIFTAVQSGDFLGNLIFGGADGAGIDDGAVIRATATENWTASAHGTDLQFQVIDNGTTSITTAMRINHDGGLVVGNASGGSQGFGTVNAGAVYDDGVLLTDYVFEHEFLGHAIDEEYADFERKSIEEELAYVKENLHLSTIIGREEWEARAAKSKKLSLGELASDLWETTEIQFLYIAELKAEIDDLRAEQEVSKADIAELLERMEALERK